MSFCWKDYIDLSNTLISSSKNNTLEKAYLRTSVSRAYYGVFCIARNYLRDVKNIQIRSQNTHEFVINKFKFSTVLMEQYIGNYLLSLRDERNKADYEDNYQIDTSIANLMLTSANQVLRFFQQLGLIF